MKKQNFEVRSATSATVIDDRRTWIYAFAILVLVSVWMLVLRLMNSPFLMLDFEVALVYLPTLLAAIVAAYVTVKAQRAK